MKFRVTPELVESVGRADKAAVPGLIEASHRTLLNVLFRATGDRARAHDLARRAFKHVMGRLALHRAAEAAPRRTRGREVHHALELGRPLGASARRVCRVRPR